MKLDQLRKIIREEVKSAVKEELQDVMNEAVKHASTPQAQEFNEHISVKPKDLSKTWTTNKPSTLDEMLNVTRAEMTTADANNIMGSTGVQKPNFASMMTNQMSRDNNGPMPGIDISSLDFVGKAKAIYDKSLEKSKASI
jgi:hypothetical protein